MKKIEFLFLFCILVLNLNAHNLDSLYSVWKDSTKPVSSRVTAYNKYIWNGYLFSKPDSVELLVTDLHTFAKTHKYPRASALAYNLQGVAIYIKGNYLLALDYYEKALAINENIVEKEGIAECLGNIGIIHFNQGNYPKALGYYEKALSIWNEIEKKSGIASALSNIGNIYTRQVNFSRALEYHEQSLAIYEEIENKRGITIALGNIGNIYSEQANYALAMEYYQKSLAIDEEIEDKLGISHNMISIGNVYKRQDNLPLALVYYQKALAINEELGDRYVIAFNLGVIGEIYQKQDNYTLALEYGLKGLDLAVELGALEHQKEAYRCLYETYKAMDKSYEALVYLEKMNVIKDSLQVEETGKKLQQMEFEKQMRQDSLAKAEEARLVNEVHRAEVRKKNMARNTAYVGGGIAILLAGGFYSRWRYVRRTKAVLQIEKDRSDNLLLNILPAEIAAELKAKGSADARDFDMVSILFTDFKEFTQASEKLSAQELVSEINACFEGFDTICDKYHIEKIKTIGDAYMAAGGLPVPSNDSVKNTVKAALEMQNFIIQRKAENEAAGKPAFEMRVGIHTGPVVAGIVGVKKFQYDIWGDTVNTAARMESNGVVSKVNISHNTYEMLKDDLDFKFEHRGKISAKDKGEVDMYFVSEKLKVKNEK